MTEEKNPLVRIETSMGNIKVELFKDKAPITVRNFLSYVKDGFYEGLPQLIGPDYRQGMIISGYVVIYCTMILCVVRGIPVLVESRRFLRPGSL